MDTTTRILELALKWQNRALWKVAADAERGAVEKRTEADRHFGSSQYMAERGHDASLWVKNAEQADRWAELRLKHVESCVNELCELANLVRAHRPELLEFVPEIDLNQEPTGAIRDLKRLESGLRKPAAAETPTGQPGQPKIIPATDPEVAEFFRLKQLPGGDEREPIEICREIHANMNGAKPESIKRKVNRFLEKHG